MTISVVIPCLNEQQFLPVCLRAVKRQKRPADEIIVVDNGSTDQTVKIAKSFKTKVIFEPRRGISFARQRGFRYAQSEVIARTDADTIPPPYWLLKIETAFIKYPRAAAITGPVFFYDAPIILKNFLNLAAWYYPGVMKRLLNHPILLGCNFAIKKNIALSLHPHLDDKSVHEDLDLACHTVEEGEIVYQPKMKMPISARRIKYQPQSFFGNYSLRLLKTLNKHHRFFIGKHRQPL